MGIIRPSFGNKPIEVPYLGTDTREHPPDSPARQRMDMIMQGVNADVDAVEVDARPMHRGRDIIPGAHATLDEELVTLKQLFETLPPDKHVYLEVKNQKAFFSSRQKHFEKKLVAFIRENDLYDRITLVGFALLSLWRIKRMDSKIDVESGVTHPRFHDVTPELVERAHRRGIRVAPWVCEQTRSEEKSLLARFMDWGVDSAYTNAPDILRKLQREEKQ